MTTSLQAINSEIALFDRVIARIKTLNRKAFLMYAVDVGSCIVHEFFDGNYAALHDRAHDKFNSFQEFLAERREQLAELDLSASTVRNYVAAAEVAQSLPPHLVGLLGLTHLSQLAIVTDPPERNRLAHEAATMQWTKQQVGLAVKQWKASTHPGKRLGAKHKPAVVKAAVALHAAARHLHRLHGAATQLDPAHWAAVKLQLLAVKKLIAGLV